MPAGTVQQVAADALFLQYAPAPPAPGVVCLVDSGVNPNSDTTPILAGSYALSPNTNTEDELAALNPPLTGGHPAAHGTYMAMIAAAPANEWGMVGLAPTSVRIYNLKVLPAGHTTFGFSEYLSALSRCQALTSSMPVTVVNLSLESDNQPTGSEREAFDNSVQSANTHGLGVVAAVGDEDGQVQAPANVEGVLGVGASDANPANLGAICSFTNHGVGLAVLAPGCDSQPESGGEGSGIEIAFSDDGTPARAEGTSEAASITSAVEASMRAYSPTLSYAQAQGCIVSTLANEGNLDVAAAFDACGLGKIVSEGMEAYNLANSTPLSSTKSTGQGSERGPANGTNASDQARLTARWKSTAKATRTSRYGAADQITGRLTTTTGQPIAGAVLEVYETPDYQGARTVALTTARTGPTGGWTLTLPRSVASGTLHFEYRSHLDDATPAAIATLALRVHAGIALRISPHVTSVGHSIHFSGVLHGAPIPTGGKQLVLEASSGGEWIQFDTIATDAKGRYRASYRFKFPGPVTYRFRVLSHYEADFPFLAGSSNVVAVRER